MVLSRVLSLVPTGFSQGCNANRSSVWCLFKTRLKKLVVFPEYFSLAWQILLIIKMNRHVGSESQQCPMLASVCLWHTMLPYRPDHVTGQESGGKLEWKEVIWYTNRGLWGNFYRKITGIVSYMYWYFCTALINLLLVFFSALTKTLKIDQSVINCAFLLFKFHSIIICGSSFNLHCNSTSMVIQ